MEKGIRIEISGEIQKDNEQDLEFTAEEKDQFNVDFIEWMETKGLLFIGIML